VMDRSRMGAPQSGQWSDGVAKNACGFLLIAMGRFASVPQDRLSPLSAKVLTNR
jgi:hypothetical protein